LPGDISNKLSAKKLQYYDIMKKIPLKYCAAEQQSQVIDKQSATNVYPKFHTITIHSEIQQVSQLIRWWKQYFTMDSAITVKIIFFYISGSQLGVGPLSSFNSNTDKISSEY